MKPLVRPAFVLLFACAVCVLGLPQTFSATNTGAEVIPLIVIDDVPLVDTIKNLARQAGLNYILDPRVAGSPVGPGSKLTQPSVKVRWENRSAEAALGAVLKEHKLAVITNAATTVARIAPVEAAVKPVPTERIGTNAMPSIPLLNLADISLQTAIESLAQATGLKVSFDPGFLKSDYAQAHWALSTRWTDITPRQALIALVDNFDLEMTEDAASSSVRISIKKPQAAK
jgi:hypothetical protein